MSQPPIPYANPSVPMPSNRPTMLTVLAILGIVFGGLGVLVQPTRLLVQSVKVRSREMACSPRSIFDVPAR